MKSFAAWSRQPSYHGSYGDYVAHMKATKEYYREQREAALVEKITSAISRAESTLPADRKE